MNVSEARKGNSRGTEREIGIKERGKSQVGLGEELESPENLETEGLAHRRER